MKKFFVFLISVCLLLLGCLADKTESKEPPTVVINTNSNQVKVDKKFSFNVVTKELNGASLTNKTDVEFKADEADIGSSILGNSSSTEETYGTIVFENETKKITSSTKSVSFSTTGTGEQDLGADALFTEPGTITVYSSVTSENGEEQEETDIQVVDNLSPVIKFAWATDLLADDDEGYPFSYSASLAGSIDEDGTIEKFTYEIFNSDGEVAVSLCELYSQTDFSFTLTKADDYVMTITAVDDKGAVDTAIVKFRVDDILDPEVELLLKDKYYLNETFYFNAKIKDRDGEFSLVEWNFGDGSTEEYDYLKNKKYEKGKLTHLYEEAGKYTVTLTVEDEKAHVTKVSKEIEIVKADLEFKVCLADGITSIKNEDVVCGQNLKFDLSESSNASAVEKVSFFFRPLDATGKEGDLFPLIDENGDNLVTAPNGGVFDTKVVWNTSNIKGYENVYTDGVQQGILVAQFQYTDGELCNKVEVVEVLQPPLAKIEVKYLGNVVNEILNMKNDCNILLDASSSEGKIALYQYFVSIDGGTWGPISEETSNSNILYKIETIGNYKFKVVVKTGNLKNESFAYSLHTKAKVEIAQHSCSNPYIDKLNMFSSLSLVPATKTYYDADIEYIYSTSRDNFSTKTIYDKKREIFTIHSFEYLFDEKKYSKNNDYESVTIKLDLRLKDKIIGSTTKTYLVYTGVKTAISGMKIIFKLLPKKDAIQNGREIRHGTYCKAIVCDLTDNDCFPNKNQNRIAYELDFDFYYPQNMQRVQISNGLSENHANTVKYYIKSKDDINYLTNSGWASGYPSLHTHMDEWLYTNATLKAIDVKTSCDLNSVTRKGMHMDFDKWCGAWWWEPDKSDCFN